MRSYFARLGELASPISSGPSHRNNPPKHLAVTPDAVAAATAREREKVANIKQGGWSGQHLLELLQAATEETPGGGLEAARDLPALLLRAVHLREPTNTGALAAVETAGERGCVEGGGL